MTEEEFQKRSGYEGNGWSKYQVMVLEQLKGHTEMFKENLKEIKALQERGLIAELNNKNWKESTDKKIEKIENHLDFILNNKEGLHYRVNKIEETDKVESGTKLKLMGLWTLLGGILIFFLNLAFNVLEYFLPKP